jgi:virulence factor Mce-like protein
MNRRSAAASLAASPVMIGAVTVLIAIVAVFLAYNANNGLPFVPSYRISAQVPDAAQLVPGNEVRIGGVRVGVIEQIEPVQDSEGNLSATLDLKLDRSAAPIPKDSTVVVRARSALGLKYLEIDKGASAENWDEGAVLPLSAATPEPVEIDEVLNTFDEPTQVAIQENLVEFGNALAGRGPDLNAAIGSLRPLLPPLERVMDNLADPSTRLARFVSALSATAAEVAPVAEQQARMFVSLDTTFTSLASVARPFIQETISESPPTLDVATRTLPRLRPFLDHSASLFTELQPGIEALRANAPTIASALEVGAPVLARSPAFNRQIPPTAAALRALNDDAAARDGIDRLVETDQLLHPTLRFLTPAQTVCNYPTLLLRNAQGIVKGGDGTGTWQTFQVFGPAGGPNNEGSPSSGPANGGEPPNPQFPGFDRNYLHVNPYPNTAAPGQTPTECEAGNEPYLANQQVIGNVPGDQGTVTEGQE